MIFFMLRWKLLDTLKQLNVTPYAVMKDSGLAANTLYGMTRGTSKSVKMRTLEAVMRSVSKLTGSPISVCDILEYQEPESGRA